MPLRVATRGSALARWQADAVTVRLRHAHPGLEIATVVVQTSGDRNQDVPISEIGGQGVFVKEVQAAVIEGRADIAVHSAKDLPSWATPGLTLAAFPVRDDPRDALVGATIAGLGPGATIATGSVRRRAQLGALRPDLAFVSLRGTIATRLQRVPRGGAIVVAAAALDRLGLTGRAAEVVSAARMLPQVAQGALAVECRTGDDATVGLLAAIDDPAVRVTVEAERAFLARIGSGCDLPVAAHATVDATGSAGIEGLIASPDGRTVLRARRDGAVPDLARMAVDLAAHLLDERGGAALLVTGP
jgi:hydroxymethylbilane synthase